MRLRLPFGRTNGKVLSTGLESVTQVSEAAAERRLTQNGSDADGAAD